MSRRATRSRDDERALWSTVTRAIEPLRRRKAVEGRGRSCAEPKNHRQDRAQAPRTRSLAPSAPRPGAASRRRSRRSAAALKQGSAAAPSRDRRADRPARHDPGRRARGAARISCAARSATAPSVVLVITGKGARPAAIRTRSAACSSARCRTGSKAPSCARFVVGFESAAHRPRRRGRALCAGAARAVTSAYRINRLRSAFFARSPMCSRT